MVDPSPLLPRSFDTFPASKTSGWGTCSGPKSTVHHPPSFSSWLSPTEQRIFDFIMILQLAFQLNSFKLYLLRKDNAYKLQANYNKSKKSKQNKTIFLCTSVLPSFNPRACGDINKISNFTWNLIRKNFKTDGIVKIKKKTKTSQNYTDNTNNTFPKTKWHRCNFYQEKIEQVWSWIRREVFPYK